MKKAMHERENSIRVRTIRESIDYPSVLYDFLAGLPLAQLAVFVDSLEEDLPDKNDDADEQKNAQHRHQIIPHAPHEYTHISAMPYKNWRISMFCSSRHAS